MENAFSKIMRKSREAAGLEQKEAAKIMGLSASYLCNIEMGNTGKPKMKTIYAAAAAYGISPDDLCAAATRIPQDVYYKIANNPKLYQAIRNMEV